MARKTGLYVTIAVLISVIIVFGSIQGNFSVEFDNLFNISNASTGNNSTMQENATKINNTNNESTTNNSIQSDISQIINNAFKTIQSTINAKITNDNQTPQITNNTSNTNPNQTINQNPVNNHTSLEDQSVTKGTVNTIPNNTNTIQNDIAQKPEAFKNQRFSMFAEQSSATGKIENFSMLQIKNLQAAAGETKTKAKVTPISFTINQIKDAAARVKSYIEAHHKLPDYVTIGTTQVKMPDFLKLMVAGLLQLKSGITKPISLKTVGDPKKPSENIKSGKINKAGYLDLAERINAFINANGILPNYVISTLGKLRYESLIYMYSRILNFQKVNKQLPAYTTLKPWTKVGTSSTGTSTIPAPLKQYLQATANCQVNNPQIKALAAKITKGTTSTYNKAEKLFNWVRDKIGYSYYYNTRYGAVGTLKKGTGNCVDTSHLLIALFRTIGIPARYAHVNAKFRNGKWYGHVLAQVYINGKWRNADATSYRNSFGVIKNWNTATAKIRGFYASLPF